MRACAVALLMCSCSIVVCELAPCLRTLCSCTFHSVPAPLTLPSFPPPPLSPSVGGCLPVTPECSSPLVVVFSRLFLFRLWGTYMGMRQEEQATFSSSSSWSFFRLELSPTVRSLLSFSLLSLAFFLPSLSSRFATLLYVSCTSLFTGKKDGSRWLDPAFTTQWLIEKKVRNSRMCFSSADLQLSAFLPIRTVCISSE